MKKVINNKVYDTAKARAVANWENDAYLPNDFHYYEETLYQKKNGQYFIYGSGNGMSPYHTTIAGAWTSGEGIRPLSFDEARNWASEHMNADDYLTEFEPDEDEKAILTIKISSKARDIGKQIALEQGTTLTKMIEDFLLNLEK
jgi:hypothetical protein